MTMEYPTAVDAALALTIDGFAMARINPAAHALAKFTDMRDGMVYSEQAASVLGAEVKRQREQERALTHYLLSWRGRAERAEADCAALREERDELKTKLAAQSADMTERWSRETGGLTHSAEAAEARVAMLREALEELLAHVHPAVEKARKSIAASVASEVAGSTVTPSGITDTMRLDWLNKHAWNFYVDKSRASWRTAIDAVMRQEWGDR